MATASGDPVQISSPEELREWLSDKPPAWAQVIAMRIALRVLPLITAVPRGGDPDDDLALLPRIGAAVVAWTGAAYPELLAKLAPKAAELASEADPALDTPPDRAAGFAALAISTACVALYPLFEPDDAQKSVMERTVETSVHASGAYLVRFESGSSDFWRAVELDASLLANTPSGSTPAAVQDLAWRELWPAEMAAPDQWALETAEFLTYLEEIDTSSEWAVWGEWFESRILGHPSFDLRSDAAERLDNLLAERIVASWLLEGVSGNRVIRHWINDAREAAANKGATTPTTRREADTPNSFIHDDVDGRVDYLGRSRLAFILAGRINQIWDDLVSEENSGAVLPEDSEDPKPGFVVHVDAP